jgi:hypothetical protein
MSKLLAARINPWIEFKIRKITEEDNAHLGLTIEIALNSYINSLNIPQEKIEKWLEEYKNLNEIDEIEKIG